MPLISLDTEALDSRSAPSSSWQEIIIEQFYYSEEFWRDGTK